MAWLNPLAFALLATLAAHPAARAEPPAASTPADAAPTASPHAAATADTPRGADTYFADLSLVDQNGRTVDLYRDAIAGHTVVMHSFYTGCTDSCPVTISKLQALQKRLGERMDRDVHIVSISVDPVHDTPAVLKAYAQRVGAKPGWLFLTGSPEQVNAALKRIGQAVQEPQAHMDLIVAGNARTGLWKKILGVAPAKQFEGLVMDVADDSVGRASQFSSSSP